MSGVVSWVNALAGSGLDVRPTALNARPADCPVLDAVAIAPGHSHRAESVAESVAGMLSPRPAGASIYLMPCWGEVAYQAAALLAARMDDVRVIAVCHADDVSYYSVIARFLPHLAMLVGVSRQIEAELRSRFPDHPVAYLPQPVPLGDACREAAAPHDRLRLIYAGRLDEPQKRVSRLCALAKALRVRGVGFSLTVAGTGVEAQALSDCFGSAGLTQDAVVMTGLVPHGEVAGLFARHDSFLMTSDYEGSPYALLEAMAAGLAPVAMAASGVSEVIVDGVNGCLVPHGDVEAMADALATLARSGSLLARLSCAAREYVREHHAPERVRQRLESILAAADRQEATTGRPVVDPWREPLDDLSRQVAGIADAPVLVYGAGMFGRALVDRLLVEGVGIDALFDRDVGKQGTDYRGLAVLDPGRLAGFPGRVVVVGSLAHIDEIVGRLRGDCPDKTVVAAGMGLGG